MREFKEKAEQIVSDMPTYARNQLPFIESALAEAYEKGLEDAINSVEGDVLVTPDEFTPNEKIRVFNMLERLASYIRELKPSRKGAE